MKSSIAASDPQTAQKRALSLIRSSVHAMKQPDKPFLHIAIYRNGSTSFVAETLDKAREILAACFEAGFKVEFAVWMAGRELTPLLVQDKAEAA
jgi:hypothetical protein